MPSSKFNQRPVPKQRPPVCIPPAGSCLPPYDVTKPERLSAWIAAVDVPPPLAYDWHAFTITGTRQTPPSYSAAIAFPAGQLHLLLEQQVPAELWTLTFTITLPPFPPGFITWTNISIDPAAAFDTGLLTLVAWPGINYYRARLTA